MGFSKQDISENIMQSVDRGEALFLMEYLCIPCDSYFRDSLNDLAVELASRAAGFLQGLPTPLVPALATLCAGYELLL